MKKLIKNLKVSQVILGIVIISLVFTLLIGALGYLNMKKLNNNTAKMYEERLVPIASLTSIRGDFLNIRVYVNKGIISYDKDIDSKIKESEKNIEQKLTEFNAAQTDAEEADAINKFKSDYSQYKITWEKSKESLEKGQGLSTEDYNIFSKLGGNIETTLKDLREHEITKANELKAQSDNIYNQSLRLFFLIYLIGMVILIIILILVIKVINSSTKEMIEVLNEVAEGNLTVNVESSGNNEFEIMKNSLRNTIENISQIVNDIKEKSYNIDEASENLSAISEEMTSSAENVSNAIQDVAKGTGEQAEELVNITTTLNRFGNELGNMVDLIKEIDINTQSIHSMADKSNGDMQNVINSVEKVTYSFKDLISKISNVGQNVNKINEITSMINSISEQTNLLALNAAIEAARAGEAGRGFSVVADEIRKLAEQSKSSLENINALINTISTDTNTMIKTTDVMKSELINQKTDIDTAIQSFTNIIKSVNEVNPKINSVSISAVKIDDEKNSILEKIEGASSIAEEVSASSEEIAASSEEMSASTEEVSRTSQDMHDMTIEMMNKVNKFKTR